MNELEKNALDAISVATGHLRKLVVDGGDENNIQHDWREITHHIHVLQRYVMANIVARENPENFRRLGASLIT